MSFDASFAMMVSIVDTAERGAIATGIVLRDGEYVPITDAQVENDWDADHYQTGMRIRARTAEREYEVEGRVLSLIPLRNRRTTPAGEELHTRITEGMTEFRCDGKVGYGMSEYLDQIVGGKPIEVAPAS
jgi:hypothetical protein